MAPTCPRAREETTRRVGFSRSGLGAATKTFCAAALACVFALSLCGELQALSVEIVSAGPSLVGQAHRFEAVALDATEPVSFQWRFGETASFEPGGAELDHVFTHPGLHGIDVTATDADGNVGSAYFRHLVHYPLTERRPTSSSAIVYDAARNRVYTVNQDNDTITAIDPDGLGNLGELEVYRKPESLALSPTGKLWVVHQDDFAVAVVSPDSFTIEGGFRLPYASQPVAIAMSPTGSAAYVTLMALGKLLALDPVTGVVTGEADVGPRPRGIAVSHDGREVYVTRFISSDEGGELVVVDANSMTTRSRILLRLDAETADSDLQARGLPNYLFSVGLTPDGRQAWLPSKKDNTTRGLLRDGQELTHDTTVRPLVCIVDLASSAELYDSRIDLDDRSMPVHVEFTPYGNLAILTLAGSNRVEIRDTSQPTQVFSAIANVGTFPRASVLAPNGRLFVQGSLSRNVLVYDLSRLLSDFDQGTPPLLAEIPTVAREKLSPEVLLGKQLFHRADDPRLTFEGYMSCGGCHFEGMDDGRVYDFTDRGEGLRNTLSLTGFSRGRLNWTGTFDEVQDFEHQIRDLFGGLGLIGDELLTSGTRSQPLGDPKAGLSSDLDALSAYVESLDTVAPSPYRNSDASLTPDGIAGRELFTKLGCDVCHTEPTFTDGRVGTLSDVGTLTPSSGSRAGEPLFGLDTPTLRGVWATPPYLHDGSAATLRDVLTTRNPSELHGYVSALSTAELDQLVAYLQQIDDELPIRPLPFDPPSTATPSTATPNTPADSDAAPALAHGEAQTQSEDTGSAGCAVRGNHVRHPDRGRDAAWVLVLGLLCVRLRRGTRPCPGPSSPLRTSRREAFAQIPSRTPCVPLALVSLLALFGQACSEPPAADDEAGRDWSELPAIHVEPELARLGVREVTFERVCARGRSDSFATALCADQEPPRIRDLAALLELTGLSNSRAFALTGNSTSLVARSVSAINPRMIVFPRVGPELERPATMTAVGFVRGEQFVEIVSRDLVTDDFNFYLLSFEQACNYEADGCDLANLSTEEIEHGWTAYSVYDHEDLEPTSFDCLSCHRPGPPGTKHILRMQELSSPWVHWFPQRFSQRTESDRVLVAQFAEAHGHEAQYGAIPISTILGAIDEGSGAQLEALLRAEGSGEQPNPFDARIAAELTRGESPTWQARFDVHLRGEAIAVPYPHVDVTEAGKRSAAVRSYLDVSLGVAPRDSLLDIRDVFSEDARHKLSFVPSPDADGRTILLQMCSRCHDGRAGPNTGKARFDVLRLDEMPRAARDLAIARLKASDETRMPPLRVGELLPAHVEAASAELAK